MLVVKIIGENNSGKSSAAVIIRKALMDAGAEVSLVDTDIPTVGIAQRRIASLGPIVEIKTENAQRSPRERGGR